MSIFPMHGMPQDPPSGSERHGCLGLFRLPDELRHLAAADLHRPKKPDAPSEPTSSGTESQGHWLNQLLWTGGYGSGTSDASCVRFGDVDLFGFQQAPVAHVSEKNKADNVTS